MPAHRTARRGVAALALVATASLPAALLPAAAAPAPAAAPAGSPSAAAPRPVPEPPKSPVAVGRGGAVSSVDPYATQIGLRVLRDGGNAVDAAVATAAALGVTEPFSAGIGGGGYLVHYDASTGRVDTIDGRETAPRRFRVDSFVEDGQPIPFAEAVTSGLSVGTPGTPLTWERALQRWGTRSLSRLLAPSAELARRGFVVDATFRSQVEANAERFAAFTPTRRLFLPGGAPPAVGSVLRNPDLARTYDLLRRRGVDAFYRGPLAREIARTAQRPPVAPGTTRTVRPGLLQASDLRAYRVIDRRPTRVRYEGLDVYGMAPSSSGGSTVGEALKILERVGLSQRDVVTSLHRYLEASALAFADRNRYVSDPAYVSVPLRQLLSQGFADERACRIGARALPKPVDPGVPDGSYERRCRSTTSGGAAPSKGVSTTHLSVVDRWGDAVSYTLTIEQTGGSGIVVPGRGFLLNNELTDFNFVPTQGSAPDPNLPAPGKRPRSSQSPTIVLRDGELFLVLGSPGGATIITTVLQTLIGRLDLGLTLPEAVAAPRASQRNSAATDAEPAFIARYGEALEALGHTFREVPEIGAVAAIEVRRNGRLIAAAEPARRGGGAAGVVRPSR